MVDTDSQTPGAAISRRFGSMTSIDGSSASVTRSYPDDSNEHREPPAKRARIFSSDVDPDMHYTAHVSPYFFLPLCTVMDVLIWHVCSLLLLPQPTPLATPLATPTTMAPAASQQESIWSASQHLFCLSTLPSLLQR